MRTISEIANEIKNDWKKVYFGAVPYGVDSADSILIYFLANAKTWKGQTAKRIKIELKNLLN